MLPYFGCWLTLCYVNFLFRFVDRILCGLTPAVFCGTNNLNWKGGVTFHFFHRKLFSSYFHLLNTHTVLGARVLWLSKSPSIWQSHSDCYSKFIREAIYRPICIWLYNMLIPFLLSLTVVIRLHDVPILNNIVLLRDYVEDWEI